MRLLEKIRESGRVFVVAVAGDSGSGKTTFTRGIRRLLGEDMVSTFSMDDYHSLDRRQRKALGITPLRPEANRLDLLAEHLEMLRRGLAIEKPVYDHATGEIRGPVVFEPTPVIVVEGLHPFYTQELRDLSDFKIFVDPSRAVKRRWKLRRDVGERGYAPEDVMREILEREPDYKLYVDVQKVYAEMVIKIQDSRIPPEWTEIARGSGSERYSVRIIQQILDQPLDEVDLTIDLSRIMRLTEREFSIEFQRDDYYGKRVGVMTLDGEFPLTMIRDLERKLCNFLGRDVPSVAEGIQDDQARYVNATEMAQLILIWRFLEKVAHLA
ncbi:phosphoribulokinase [Methanothrix sp.]|uniref:phosphoribulokinase n=1 Tax=Methanothrix sp. TaxID=90426 RepID=UPI003C741BC0